MARDIGSKCKQCRRAGEKLFLKGERCKTGKCAMVKRNYPPGFHGPKNRRRMSSYGTQLNEKQKAKRQYNVLEKQFKLTFDRAKSKTGNLGENFLKMLESRLDNVVYRAGFASSRPQARQLVNHGLLSVNGRKTSIPSRLVKAGDEVSIKAEKKDAGIFANLKEKMKNHEAPGWMNIDTDKMTIKILHTPDMKAINPNFSVQMIVEYYSK